MFHIKVVQTILQKKIREMYIYFRKAVLNSKIPFKYRCRYSYMNIHKGNVENDLHENINGCICVIGLWFYLLFFKIMKCH